jgi:hypothetical protein
MIYEWNVIREKEIYFRREIYRLNNIKKDRELNSKKFSVPIKKNKDVSKQIEDKDNKGQKELRNSKIKIVGVKVDDISEEEQ